MSEGSPVIALSEEAALAAWELCEAATPAQRWQTIIGYAAPAAGVGEKTVGAQDKLLFDVYAATFGERVDATVNCASCGELLELSFDVAALRGAHGEVSPRFTLPSTAGGDAISVRLPTPQDLAAAARANSHEAARNVLIARCVQGPPGTALPEEAVAQAAGEMARRDPQSAVAVQLTCDGCGQEQVVPFAIDDFLWRRVAITAAQVLDDVHELAVTYGWSEAETLAVPAARRRRYLERVTR